MVLKLSTYCAELHRHGGVIAEFVNPKYADASKTAFKSSTRLECMMQVGWARLVSHCALHYIWLCAVAVRVGLRGRGMRKGVARGGRASAGPPRAAVWSDRALRARSGTALVLAGLPLAACADLALTWRCPCRGIRNPGLPQEPARGQPRGVHRGQPGVGSVQPR